MRQTKFLSDQRGIGLIVEIIIGAVVLGVIGLGVMQYMKAKNATGGGGGGLIPAKLTLNGNCELKDTDLCKFVNNAKAMASYNVKAVTTAKDGKKSESTIEIDGEDKFHMVISDGGKEGYNLITIGKTTYMKDYSDNKWLETTYDEKENKDIKSDYKFDADLDKEKDKPAEQKTKYKAMGKEACDSLKCFKYEVVEPGIEGQQFIWFDDRDYLLRRMQTVNAEGTTDMTFSYKKPNISKPSPTKKAEAGAPSAGIDAAKAAAAAAAANANVSAEANTSADTRYDANSSNGDDDSQE